MFTCLYRFITYIEKLQNNLYKPRPVHHREQVHHRFQNNRNLQNRLNRYRNTMARSRNFRCKNSSRYKSNMPSSHMLWIHSHCYSSISSQNFGLIFHKPCKHRLQLFGIFFKNIKLKNFEWFVIRSCGTSRGERWINCWINITRGKFALRSPVTSWALAFKSIVGNFIRSQIYNVKLPILAIKIRFLR